MKKIFRILFRPHWKKLMWMAAIFSLWYFSLPSTYFDQPYSTVVVDRTGKLLGARIAADGQWRFPPIDTVPERFAKALVTFEDQHYYEHPGINMGALLRATRQNFRNRRVVSGGSTLTMQVCRLMRGDRPRSIFEKAIEATMATRLEIRHTKDEILAMWASHAPFGGNVVGLDAAAWRYFGRQPEQLSWAETATLAVLPNSPSLIHPGKNCDRLKAKRDRLLLRLQEAGEIDSATCALAMLEPLPGAPLPLPNLAPHLLDRIQQEHGSGIRMRSTLDLHLQARAEAILARHQRRLSDNGIHNAAAIVLDVRTGDVLVYQGNVLAAGPEHGCAVDIAKAPRSTGSILKPFLYAAMLTDGEILPNTLVPDIPTHFGAYSPQNYDRSYDGAVPAHRALARSLNIPAVRMLHGYGHHRFHQRLQNIGMSTLDHSADHYGLSLILGGAEATLWDLAGMYASMARTVNDYPLHNGRYDPDGFRAPNYEFAASTAAGYEPVWSREGELGAGACYLALKAMVEVTRPNAEQNWEAFSSSERIAWKTGTSFGFRDAWAVGCTPEHVVAVWAGNADGEGRPGLVGLHAAAPLMFDLFDALPGGGGDWFQVPYDDMEEIAVCKQSGHRASGICDETVNMRVPLRGLDSKPCPYHRLVHLDATGQRQVHSECASPFEMEHRPWFVLPPAQEEWYRRRHADYAGLPPFAEACRDGEDETAVAEVMEFIYPRTARELYVPVGLDGKPSSVVVEVSHRQEESKIYWHLDREFLGATKTFHQMALNPKPGKHTLTLVDEDGHTLKKDIVVVGKEA